MFMWLFELLKTERAKIIIMILLFFAFINVMADSNRFETVARMPNNQWVFKFHDGPVTCYVLSREYQFHGNDSLSCVSMK